MIRTRKGHIISGSFFRASCDDDCVMMMMMSRCVKCLNACAVEMSRCGIQEYGMKGSLASGRLWQVLSCVCVCACVCVCVCVCVICYAHKGVCHSHVHTPYLVTCLRNPSQT